MATTIIGILLIVMAVFLVIAVLMQSSKDHRLGASIAGGAETFFGKTKGKSMDALFNKLTTVIAILFVILVIVLYVIQPESCAFCGSPEHEAATIEECPTYLAQVEAEDEAESGEAEDEAVVDDTAEETPADGEDAAPEVADEETPADGEEAPVEGEDTPEVTE